MERIDYISKLTNIVMKKTRIQQYVDDRYYQKIKAYDFLIEVVNNNLIDHKYIKRRE